MESTQKLLERYTAPGYLFEKQDDGSVCCVACGHRCSIPPGQSGNCRVRFNRDGILQVPFGYVSGIQCDPIEKKPLRRFYPGAKIGVVGENGAGKSTLLRIMAGQDKDFQGEAEPCKGVRVGYVPQEPQLDPTRTVKGNLELAFGEIMELLKEFDELSMKMCEVEGDEYDKVANRMAAVQDKIDAADGWNIDQKLSVAANALVLPPDDMDVTTLSGGERNRVHMAKLLKSGGNVLLLDEPTNDLDVETLQALEAALDDFAGCAVIISHDRFFLDRLCTHILAFEGEAHVEWFEGNFEAYEEDKKRRLGADSLMPKRIKYKKFARV